MNCLNKNMSTKLAITVVLIICLYTSTTEARPSESLTKNSDVDLEIPDPSLYNGNLSPQVIQQIQKCDRDMETMELCMRCAKVTKSEIVYPMCCDNEEDVKNWCRSYIYFGASPSPY